jgi:CRP/FNR family transcriptional regulator, cyclic AMP receptor protein
VLGDDKSANERRRCVVTTRAIPHNAKRPPCGGRCWNLIGQPKRLSTATAMTECVTMRVDKAEIIRVLHDQLFNSTEKRLARMLLLLANFGKEGKPEPIIAKITQETLAKMIGTARARVSHFMNKFRQLGFIDYNGHLEVHSSLLSVVLNEQPNNVERPPQ